VTPAWQLYGMSRPAPPAHKTRNRPDCNAVLKRCGSLLIWLDPTMIWEAELNRAGFAGG
jgi:hypothetical protein